jgi:predicted GNAT superfamily acetyltransferase
VLGAFLGEQMIGFSLAFPGVKDGGRPYWHSHMTGVLPDYQNRRIGRQLKLFQRQEAVRAGIDLIEWTFDPLEIRNAYFNIERLGVIVSHFLPNQYGITSSRLHGGLPTDRLVAEWHVRSERVERAIDGPPLEAAVIVATIEIPTEIPELRDTEVERAREIQTRVREEFQQHLAAGLTVVGYRTSSSAGVYQLAKL